MWENSLPWCPWDSRANIKTPKAIIVQGILLREAFCCKTFDLDESSSVLSAEACLQDKPQDTSPSSVSQTQLFKWGSCIMHLRSSHLLSLTGNNYLEDTVVSFKAFSKWMPSSCQAVMKQQTIREDVNTFALPSLSTIAKYELLWCLPPRTATCIEKQLSLKFKTLFTEQIQHCFISHPRRHSFIMRKSKIGTCPAFIVSLRSYAAGRILIVIWQDSETCQNYRYYCRPIKRWGARWLYLTACLH